MKTQEMVDHVAGVTGLTKAKAKDAIEAVFNGILTAAKHGNQAEYAGFGKFAVKHSAERQGRNPATGEAITIAASRKLTFAPHKRVKDELASVKPHKRVKDCLASVK